MDMRLEFWAFVLNCGYMWVFWTFWRRWQLRGILSLWVFTRILWVWCCRYPGPTCVSSVCVVSWRFTCSVLCVCWCFCLMGHLMKAKLCFCLHCLCVMAVCFAGRKQFEGCQFICHEPTWVCGCVCVWVSVHVCEQARVWAYLHAWIFVCVHVCFADSEPFEAPICPS